MKNILTKRKNGDRNWELDPFFSDFFRFRSPFWAGTEDWPPVDITETENDYYLFFEVPGMEKKDIKVTVTNNVLTISGNREMKEAENDESYIRREIVNGSFERRFTLPETIKSDSVKADYKNGILKVHLQKKEETKPTEIEIRVS